MLQVNVRSEWHQNSGEQWKQTGSSAISRCLAISVRESSASAITAAVKPALVSTSATLPGIICSRGRLGVKFQHEHILRLGNAGNVFCLSPSLTLIFSAVQQDLYKIPNPGYTYLKALQIWSFLQCRNCIIPQILNSSQETDPALLEEEYIHYSWAQRYCFGWRPAWKCQLCYFSIWNVSQRITKVLNDIRFWARTIVLVRTYNVHPKFLNFLNYLLITV